MDWIFESFLADYGLFQSDSFRLAHFERIVPLGLERLVKALLREPLARISVFRSYFLFLQDGLLSTFGWFSNSDLKMAAPSNQKINLLPNHLIT